MSASPSSQDSGASVRFGFVPTTQDLNDRALLEQLTHALGPEWSVRPFRMYAELVEQLGKGQIDVAWMPPLAYARAARARAAELVLTLERDGQSSYASAIVSREPGPTTLSREFLEGKRAAWVDVWSAAGYLVPRLMLRAAGMDPEKLFASQMFMGSHTGVVEALVNRAADVGGIFCALGPDRTIVRGPLLELHKLHVLAVSEPIPGDTICVSPGRDASDIGASLSRLMATDETRALVLRLFGADRFVPAVPERYASLEAALAEEMESLR